MAQDRTKDDTLYDDSIITIGTHQGKKLEDVPAEYLLWWYEKNNNITQSHKQYNLKEYIEDNMDVLNKEVKESKPLFDSDNSTPNHKRYFN